jgi:hypothetical protein
MRVEGKPVTNYHAVLKENSRPPSRGGNTRAWHRHSFVIDGESYSFLALGAKKWVFVGDTVSFDWKWDGTGKYRNVDTASVEARNSAGKIVVRGERGTKSWRTAQTRLPGRRREWKD